MNEGDKAAEGLIMRNIRDFDDTDVAMAGVIVLGLAGGGILAYTGTDGTKELISLAITSLAALATRSRKGKSDE